MCQFSGKLTTGRPKRRWVDNIESDARDLVLEGS